MHSRLKRGQAATETVLLVAVVTVLVLFFLLGAFREWELAMAVGSARQGALQLEALYPQHHLTRVLSSETQNSTLLQAVFTPPLAQAEEAELRSFMLEKVRSALEPTTATQNNCIRTMLRNYCV